MEAYVDITGEGVDIIARDGQQLTDEGPEEFPPSWQAVVGVLQSGQSLGTGQARTVEPTELVNCLEVQGERLVAGTLLSYVFEVERLSGEILRAEVTPEHWSPSKVSHPGPVSDEVAAVEVGDVLQELSLPAAPPVGTQRTLEIPRDCSPVELLSQVVDHAEVSQHGGLALGPGLTQQALLRLLTERHIVLTQQLLGEMLGRQVELQLGDGAGPDLAQLAGQTLTAHQECFVELSHLAVI